jgi:hypothetical protein
LTQAKENNEHLSLSKQHQQNQEHADLRAKNLDEAVRIQTEKHQTQSKNNVEPIYT